MQEIYSAMEARVSRTEPPSRPPYPYPYPSPTPTPTPTPYPYQVSLSEPSRPRWGAGPRASLPLSPNYVAHRDERLARARRASKEGIGTEVSNRSPGPSTDPKP